MNKKTKAGSILGAIVILAAILSVWGFSKWQGKDEAVLGETNSGIAIFYGKGCPHCKDLDDFIAQNSLDEKVKMDKKEVWFNKENAKVLMAKADECGIAKDKVGVPFLYSEGKCFSGTPDIEKFLMEKAGTE